MMMEDRTALGVYLNNGEINSSVSITTIAITTLDTAVLPPAISLTADRDKEAVGKKYRQINDYICKGHVAFLN
jgi:hypothetical protein